MKSSEITLSNGLRPMIIDTVTGTPLLLLHGAESGAGQYDDLIQALPASIRSISFDQRDTADTGDGSGGAGQPYDLGDIADDAAAVLDALSLARAHVLGTSFGGAVAQHLALRHPERVRSLILVATTASSAPVRAYLARSDSMTADERRQWTLDGAVSPAGQRDAALVERVRAGLVERAPDQRARRLGALATHDTTAEVGRIAAPTLVIHGDDDPVMPLSSGEFLATTIPGADLAIIEGGRHALAFEYRSRVAELVRTFVEKHDDGS
ncbi:alpha/beta hydrolase [Streptosporangium fragile]|uniref:Alpha/beta hydrolase n=1 Tax=Streptosporangium fragile TaxID=46186 RepID=A0ABN3W5R0_9ACTN